MSRLPVYLDCHATTPVDPRVFEAMRPWLTGRFGNAASVNHAYGWQAAEAIDQARDQISHLLNTPPESVVFTSGATESCNLALKGVLRRARGRGHLITTVAEHRAVLDPARRLMREGAEITFLPVDRDAAVDPNQVEQALRPETALVSILLANNEVGTINPVEEIAALCRRRGVPLHCDAAQAVGHLPLDLSRTPIDLLSFSGHKFHAPQGIGGLIVRRGDNPARLEPLIDGGGHQGGLRSGTLSVPLCVSLGAACEVAAHDLAAEQIRVALLRDRLWAGLSERLEGIERNGHPLHRLPGNLHVSFDGVDGEALMTALREIAVSSGSACTTADPEPSHVLRAMGISEARSRASVRFGLGRFTAAEEIEFAIGYVADTVSALRAGRRTAG